MTNVQQGYIDKINRSVPGTADIRPTKVAEITSR